MTGSAPPRMTGGHPSKGPPAGAVVRRLPSRQSLLMSMDRMEQAVGTSWIKEFLIGVGITALFFILLAVSPTAGVIVGLFAPLPVMYFYSRLGSRRGIVYFLASVAFAGLCLSLAGMGGDVSFFLIVGSLGVVLPEMMKRNWGIEKTVLLSVAAILSAGLVFLAYSSSRLSTPPDRLVENYIYESVQNSIRFYGELGLPSEQIEAIKENAEEVTKTIFSLFPSILLVSVVFFVWVNLISARFLFQKTGIPCPDYGDLSFWKVPDWLVWFVILSGGMMLVPQPEVKTVGLNLLIIFLFVYLLQGFSIVSFFFKKKNVPGFLRIFFYLFLFVYQTLLLFVAGIGLFDIWIDFRKMTKPLKDTTV